MTTALAVAIAVSACACIALTALWLKARSDRRRLSAELGRFGQIADLERHAQDQIAKAEAASVQVSQAQLELDRVQSDIAARQATATSLAAELETQQRALATAAEALGEYRTLEELRKQIDKQKQISNQYNQVLGNFKTADELRTHINQQKERINELNRTIGKFESLPELDRQIATQKAQMAVLESRIRDLNDVLGGADSAYALHARIKSQEGVLAQLQAQTVQVEEAREMQEFGFYRPRYDFDSSSKYQDELDRVRDRQTDMVKSETAVNWEKTWMVEGSAAQGRKMMKEQTKLMLRAFNGECDAAVAKVKYNNATTLESRIERSFEQINKLGKTNSASVSGAFLQLKLDELHLVHEHRVKQQQEKEEQQRIRDQMREEEKARREIEDAQEKAAREEELAERALEKARRTFEEAARGQREQTEQTKAHNEALAIQVAKLENELKEAIDRKAKAIARAQLTKSGYIYVLSNFGSFGGDVYKLGMTRRLDPLERVKELGDASVPFPFDVHAVIYSENAPALECQLHRHFADRRVNLVNLRREYFRVSLEEIIEAVKEYFGVITFVKFPEAAEYRETMAKLKADGKPLPASPALRYLEPAVS